MLLVFLVLTGLAYPMAITGIAQVAFPRQANGSLIVQDGKTVGSELIGQPFSDPKYFWSRPSATSPAYNGGASSGSNYGPLNPALADRVKASVEALKASDPGNTAPIPVDLVTASASGLDPHISVAAAQWQVPRVARQRGMDTSAVEQLVQSATQRRALGVLGEDVVNVLQLNLALDRAVTARTSASAQP
jgi:K+-transporting ATPase ATPase C chain